MTDISETTAQTAPPQADQTTVVRLRETARQRGRSPWLGFAYRRAGGLLLSFAVLIVVTFLIVPLIPGDPAVVAAGEGATSDQIEFYREQLGLNQPLIVQFVNYLGGVLTLDLGTSFLSGQEVWSLILGRLPYTATIAFSSIALVLLISVPLGMGVALATRGGRNAWLDHLFNGVTALFNSVPQYVMATLLVFVFAVSLGLLPAAGATGPGAAILPTLSLMIGPTCVIARTVRRETGVVLGKDFVRTAKGWRLTGLRTTFRYILPNLITTTLTLSGLILAAQLGGTVIVETVFAWPGIGSAVVEASLMRDYPVIRGIVLVLGMLATIVIILVDIALALIDPRNTLGGQHVR